MPRHNPAPRRLRRSEIGATDPSGVGGTASLPEQTNVHGHRGFPDGTSNEAAARSAGTYKDAAAGAASDLGSAPLRNEPAPLGNLSGETGGERK